jgi:hypothetical protein
MSDGSGVINLTALAVPKGHTPSDKLSATVEDNHTDIYFWNPCNSFELDHEAIGLNECTVKEDVAICDMHNTNNSDFDPEILYNLGSQSSVHFEIVEKVVFVSYTYTGDSTKKTSRIKLACIKDGRQDDPVFEYIDGNGTHYEFLLKSVCACPGGCPQTSRRSSSGGLSPGSILLIIFFVLVALYLLVGVSYQVVMKKANGVEMIPNSGFWCSLPGYIKDGMVLVFCCSRKGGGKASYSQF